jgi:hypothetical protein
MNTIPQHLDLTPAQIALLSDLTARTQKSPQQVVDDALRHYSIEVRNDAVSGESLYDRLARDGLIGCLEGGPPDLSTNPKYMKGFGE